MDGQTHMRVNVPASPKKAFKTSFAEAALKLGVVGAFEGPPDLARNHRRYLKVTLRGRRRATTKTSG